MLQAEIPSAPPAPPVTAAPKRRTKTSAQRREQAKRSAARAAADACAADLATPTPPTSPLHTPSATSALFTSSTAARLADIALAPSPHSPPPLAAPVPRDLLVLTGGPDARPWRSIRTRRHRAHRPHRHERIARAEVRAPNDFFACRHGQIQNDTEELRAACFDALGPLYATMETAGGTGAATPIATHPPPHAPPPSSSATLPGHSPCPIREDTEECWLEIVRLGALGARILAPHIHDIAQLAANNFHQLEHFRRDEFISAHSALVLDANAFDTHYLDDFTLPYVIGLAQWFIEGGEDPSS